MDTFDLYKDIQCRTNGEIYLGVVGPVRSGKSTFITLFLCFSSYVHRIPPFLTVRKSR